MGSNIEYRFDGTVTEPAIVNAIVIPMEAYQYAQIKVFAVCGDDVGDGGTGGVDDYYVFGAARCGVGGAIIEKAFADIIIPFPTTNIIELDVNGSNVLIKIFSKYGAATTARWALRASVDFVDNVQYSPA